MKNQHVYNRVHDEKQRTQCPLHLKREPPWIDDRGQIVLDEAALIHYSAALCTKPVF